MRDRYYEPLLAFAGWRQAEIYDNGNVTLWTKEDVPPAQAAGVRGFRPTEMQGMMWGILPVAMQPVGAVPGSAGARERRCGRPRWNFRPQRRSNR